MIGPKIVVESVADGEAPCDGASPYLFAEHEKGLLDWVPHHKVVGFWEPIVNVEGVTQIPDPLELAIDHMAFKRRSAYKEKMRERKAMGRASEPIKPKPEIWERTKWNASVAAEIAKQANQANWIQQKALAASNGM